MKSKQYKKLIESYRQCLVWNNPNVNKNDLNKFMSLYLLTPSWYKTDTRNYHMFWFPKIKLSKKLKHKRERILRKYLS